MALVAAHGEAADSTHLFDGTCEGRLDFAPHGAADSVMIRCLSPTDSRFRFAGLGEAVKNQISHRAGAGETQGAFCHEAMISAQAESITAGRDIGDGHRSRLDWEIGHRRQCSWRGWCATRVDNPWPKLASVAGCWCRCGSGAEAGLNVSGGDDRGFRAQHTADGRRKSDSVGIWCSMRAANFFAPAQICHDDAAVGGVVAPIDARRRSFPSGYWQCRW